MPEKKRKIWLVGNGGMLGTDMEYLLKEKGERFVVSDLEVDITMSSDIAKFGDSFFTDEEEDRWIVNCAAYTAVDQAEDEPEKAYLINADGVSNLAVYANRINAKILHISTDYVFDGSSERPLREEEPAGPVSVYGKSKWQGEENLKNQCGRFFIIRTAWLYGKHGSNFVYTMMRLMKSRTNVKVVNDQHGSPTYTRDLADAMMAVIMAGSDRYGIYHYTNEGVITWYDFASKIRDIAVVRGLLPEICSVLPCSSSEFPTKAQRPSYSILDKTKIKQEFSLHIPSWEESLSRFIAEMDPKDI